VVHVELQAIQRSFSGQKVLLAVVDVAKDVEENPSVGDFTPPQDLGAGVSVVLHLILKHYNFLRFSRLSGQELLLGCSFFCDLLQLSLSVRKHSLSSDELTVLFAFAHIK